VTFAYTRTDVTVRQPSSRPASRTRLICQKIQPFPKSRKYLVEAWHVEIPAIISFFPQRLSETRRLPWNSSLTCTQSAIEPTKGDLVKIQGSSPQFSGFSNSVINKKRKAIIALVFSEVSGFSSFHTNKRPAFLWPCLLAKLVAAVSRTVSSGATKLSDTCFLTVTDFTYRRLRREG